MNIILTNFCNGKCPYCFAADTMYGEKSQNLEDEFSIKDFSLVLDHLYTNNPNQAVRLLGGEPTKHSRLDEILNMIIQKGFKRIIIFSNGIIDNKNKEILKKYLDNISFIWNINPPDIYPEAINKNINDCVKELSTSGSIHISKLAKERVVNIEDYVKVGDNVTVKIIAVDKEKGRVGLERIIKETV